MGFHKNTVICLKLHFIKRKLEAVQFVNFISPLNFDNVVDETCLISIKHFCVSLGHMGFHRNSVVCLKIATSFEAKPDTFQLYPFITTLFPHISLR